MVVRLARCILLECPPRTSCPDVFNSRFTLLLYRRSARGKHALRIFLADSVGHEATNRHVGARRDCLIWYAMWELSQGGASAYRRHIGAVINLAPDTARQEILTAHRTACTARSYYAARWTPRQGAGSLPRQTLYRPLYKVCTNLKRFGGRGSI